MKRKSFLLQCILILLFPFLLWGNAAEPPYFTVLILNPPEDLILALRDEEGKDLPLEPRWEKRAWEGYCRFFRKGGKSPKGATLHVEEGKESWKVTVPVETFDHYNNLVTLDVKTRSLTLGQPSWRLPFLVSMRVILTLLIEGLVFYLFGYREKRSWLLFLAVNLLTQTGINASITGPLPFYQYSVFGLYIMEGMVLLVEVPAFILLLKEHKKTRAALMAVLANGASMVVGGWILTYLPF